MRGVCFLVSSRAFRRWWMGKYSLKHLARLGFCEQESSQACLQKYTILSSPTFVPLHHFCLLRARFISRKSISVAHVQIMNFTTLNPFGA